MAGNSTVGEQRVHLGRAQRLGIVEQEKPLPSPVIELPQSKPMAKPLSRHDQCAHRGGLSRTEQCPSCKGNVQVNILSCAVHGECTLSVKDVGVKRCRDCSDFVLQIEAGP